MSETGTGMGSRRGFLVMDAIAGIVLALFLLMVMTVSVVKQGRREQELAEIRARRGGRKRRCWRWSRGRRYPRGRGLRNWRRTPWRRAWVRVTAKVARERRGLSGWWMRRRRAAMEVDDE